MTKSALNLHESLVRERRCIQIIIQYMMNASWEAQRIAQDQIKGPSLLFGGFMKKGHLKWPKDSAKLSQGMMSCLII